MAPDHWIALIEMLKHPDKTIVVATYNESDRNASE